MAKKTTKEEITPVVLQVETIVEEVVVLPEVEEVVEVVYVQPAPATEAKPATPLAGNEVGVVNIVQKTPSGYRILLETGETIRVTKAQYTKGDKTIIL